MADNYKAQMLYFNAPPVEREFSLKGAIDAMMADECHAIVMDVVPESDLEDWWEDDGFATSPFTYNAHHAGIQATAVTLGQLQRETDEDLVVKTAEYFSLASRLNQGLRETKFVKFFADGLDAAPLTIGREYNAEYLMATKRVYEPFDKPFNFAPHCDDISYSRDTTNWPQRRSYTHQLGSFLTIEGSANDAGMVLWDNVPESRAKLDVMNKEYRETGTIAELDASDKLVIKPQPGQLTIFHSKRIHAIEQCQSRRRTMGLFLIEKEDGWKFFD
ncbi:MAG: hypothetical protein RID91_20575 [Azospirillaceae bacterium]